MATKRWTVNIGGASHVIDVTWAKLLGPGQLWLDGRPVEAWQMRWTHSRRYRMEGARVVFSWSSGIPDDECDLYVDDQLITGQDLPDAPTYADEVRKGQVDAAPSALVKEPNGSRYLLAGVATIVAVGGMVVLDLTNDPTVPGNVRWLFWGFAALFLGAGVNGIISREMRLGKFNFGIGGTWRVKDAASDALSALVIASSVFFFFVQYFAE